MALQTAILKYLQRLVIHTLRCCDRQLSQSQHLLDLGVSSATQAQWHCCQASHSAHISSTGW